MTILGELSPAQELLVKEICFKQLSSLRRLYNNKSNSPLVIANELEKNEVSKEEFLHQLELRMEKVKKISVSPCEINSLENFDLSVFKHILSTLEEKYQERYPQAIANLWNRLFIIEDFGKFDFNIN